NFLEKYYHSVNLGAQNGMTLRGLDGIVRASYGVAAVKLDKDKMPEGLSAELAQSPVGYFWGGEVIDGVKRLILYRVVTGYPLLITLGIAESEILADYYFRRTIYVSVVLVLTLMVLVAVFASIRRQLSLERTNRRFDMALENMTHGLCMFDAQ